jgi:hypothetical protein
LVPGGNQGQYFNGTDASDFGAFNAFSNIGTGGQITNNRYNMSAGGTIKNMNGWLGVGPIDQLSGLNWYTVIGPYGPGGLSFYIQCSAADHIAFPMQCPTAGGPFVDFTRNGVSVAGENNEQWKYRPLSDPGPGAGFVDNNYTKYGGATINGLNVLGYSVANATGAFNTRAGAAYYNSNVPSWWWDPTIMVPGLPAAHNGL